MEFGNAITRAIWIILVCSAASQESRTCQSLFCVGTVDAPTTREKLLGNSSESSPIVYLAFFMFSQQQQYIVMQGHKECKYKRRLRKAAQVDSRVGYTTLSNVPQVIQGAGTLATCAQADGGRCRGGVSTWTLAFITPRCQSTASNSHFWDVGNVGGLIRNVFTA